MQANTISTDPHMLALYNKEPSISFLLRWVMSSPQAPLSPRPLHAMMGWVEEHARHVIACQALIISDTDLTPQ